MAEQTFSANADAPQVPYSSALGDVFASGLYQTPWGMPPPVDPRYSVGMQSLVPNDPSSSLRNLAPLLRGGVTVPLAGGALSLDASAVPYQRTSPYVGLTYRRQF
jgi:hypothetical protein